MRDKEECLAAMSTILAKLDVWTVEEVTEAIDDNGWSGVFDLINEKYNKLLREGKITHDPMN